MHGRLALAVPVVVAGLLSILVSLPSDALSAGLVRCEVPLSHDGGEAHRIAGWGADEGEASRAASRAARLLATERFARWSWMLALGHEDDAAGLRALLDRPSLDLRLGLPGWSLGAASCAAVDLPAAAAGTWSVTWPGSPEPVVRADPAVALEAARRRTCLSDWQAELTRALEVRHHHSCTGSAEEPMHAGLDLAGESLTACWTGAASPEPADAAPPTPGLAADWYACERWGVEVEQGPVVAARGWGGSLEQARERALAQLAELSLLRGTRQAFSGVARAPVEWRPTVVTHGISQALTSVVPGGDREETATLACRAVDAGGPVTWMAGEEEQQECSKGTWPRSGARATGAVAAASGREALCGAELEALVARLHATLPDADSTAVDTITAGGWELGLRCSVACRAAVTVATASRPAAFQGDPDTSSEAAVRAMAHRALLERRPGLLAAVLPLILDDPDSFGRMADQLVEGEPLSQERVEEALEWFEAVSFGGRWYLLPPG